MLSKVILTLVLVSSTTLISRGAEKSQVFSLKEVYGVDGYQRTLHKAFPGIQLCAFHSNGQALFGVYRHTIKHKLLIVLSNDTGTIKIKKNNQLLANNTLSPATIRVMGNKALVDGKIVPDPENILEMQVGVWMPFSQKDTLNIEGSIGTDSKSTFSLDYDPDSSWASSMTKPVFDKGAIKKADAYHFTEDSLLEDIRKILAKQPTCRVKMKQNRILTIKRWKKDPNAPLDPMVVNLREKISINDKEAEEELRNSLELRNRLDFYQAGARAGGYEPKIILRTTRKTNDKLFRETLHTFEQLRIRHVEMVPLPPVNPPRKTIHIPLPRKP